jgi:telomerase reverse transcriptase
VTQLQTKSPHSTLLTKSLHDGSLLAETPSVEKGDKEACPSRVKQPKLSLTDYATPASSVSAFCRAVLQKLMPPVFFGNGLDGVCNRRIVLKQVDTFIKMRRYESLSLHEVCKGLKVCFPIRGIHWVGRRY